MANFFYIGADGNKQGPYNDQQLKALATQGVISPNTHLETDDGHKGLAGQINGLFAGDLHYAQAAQGTPAGVSVFCTNCGKHVSEHAVACMS
jgi:hypothetical protein